MYFLVVLIESLWIGQIEAGPGGAGKVQADQLVLSEQVGRIFSLFHHLTALAFSLLQDL